MALYQQDKAIFYLPCESATEVLKQSAWSPQNITDYGSGIVGGGLHSASASTDTRLASANAGSIYPTAISATCKRLLAVCWVSGYRSGNNTNIGWLSSTTLQASRAGFQLEESTPGYKLRVRTYVNSAENSILSNVITSGNTSGWQFIAMYSAVSDGLGSGWISFNGGPWLLAVSGALANTDTDQTMPGFYRYRAAGAQEWRGDEAAMWADVDLPSNADIQKMYQLGVAGLPLNQFTTSGLYKPTNLVFYNQFEQSRIESLFGKGWSATNLPTYAPFINGSGMFAPAGHGASLYTVGNTDHTYPYVSGTTGGCPTNLFSVFWTSGVGNATSVDRGIGWNNGTSSIQHGMQFRVAGPIPYSGYAVTTPAYSGGQLGTVGAAVYPERTDVMMVAMWMQYLTASTAIGCISINGGPWLTSFSGALAKSNVDITNPAIICTGSGSPSAFDESALWQNLSVQPDQSDLNKMYRIGLSGLPLTAFSSFAGLPSGGFLKPANLAFYHPLDSDVEYTQQIPWTGNFATEALYAPAVLGSGYCAPDYTTGLQAKYLANGNNTYRSPSGSESLTAAFWASGIQQGGQVTIGWGSWPLGFNRNNIGIKGSGYAGIQLVGTVGGTALNSDPWFINLFTNPLNFVVVRFEPSGSSMLARMSVNGSSWATLSSWANPGWSTSNISDLALNVQHQYAPLPTLVDELAVWRDAPAFTSDELAKLYLLGATGKPMSAYSTLSLPSSGTMPLAITGKPIPTLWSPNNAVFYMNCDGTREAVQNLDWTTANLWPDSSGVVGSGYYGNSNKLNITYANTGNQYLNPSGVTRSMTAVMWASGHNVVGRKFGCGWVNGAGGQQIENGITWARNNPNTGQVQMVVASRHGGTGGSNAWTNYPASNGYIFYAGHVQWLDATTAALWLSINGGPWIAQGSGTCNLPDNSWGKATSVSVYGSSGGEALVDEAAFWTDANQPTEADINKMYQMGLAGVPLNQFNIYSAPTTTSGTAPLVVSGAVPMPATGMALLAISGAVPPQPPDTPSSSDSFDFSIEKLLATLDHRPQVVGKLAADPEEEEVTIEVWRCTASGVETVTLVSNQCYPIGDTGRWGWSTANLDNGGGNDRRTYFFRMRSTSGNKFEGAFFVNDITGMPGSMRRARRRER